MPVGGHRTFPADVRVIAASNRDLRVMVREGSFRPDLFYRLNVISLKQALERSAGGHQRFGRAHFWRGSPCAIDCPRNISRRGGWSACRGMIGLVTFANWRTSWNGSLAWMIKSFNRMRCIAFAPLGRLWPARILWGLYAPASFECSCGRQTGTVPGVTSRGGANRPETRCGQPWPIASIGTSLARWHMPAIIRRSRPACWGFRGRDCAARSRTSALILRSLDRAAVRNNLMALPGLSANLAGDCAGVPPCGGDQPPKGGTPACSGPRTGQASLTVPLRQLSAREQIVSSRSHRPLTPPFFAIAGQPLAISWSFYTTLPEISSSDFAERWRSPVLIGRKPIRSITVLS